VKNKLAIIGVSAAALTGAVAGLAFGVPGIAGAQTDPGVTVAASGTTTAPVPGADRATFLQDTLAPLVADGTITQAQADKVVAALQAAKPARGDGDGGRHGRGPGMKGAGLDTAATAIGITPDELRTALESGQSVADVAKSKNVEVQKVIDALVAERKTGLDQAVKDARLTQAEADERLAQATTAVTAFVNGQMPAGGMGRGHGHDHGPWGGGTAPSSAPATDQPA
jgi:hypothetical protein